ncbi:sugar transferase [Alkalibacillus haloalkaliphilus]|uniref:sugar transferase n=1 Tax=Alkalibacillus haloalkaliphilus TaxID=94136 RepID=UPI0003011643|nr:sugar transferase [Alkalibacillus haloalkaliphilus]
MLNSLYRNYFKRVIDFTLALIAIILLSPILVLVALLVRVKLGSPVLFKQNRPGLNEKLFTMYKFRTMSDQRDRNGDLLPDQQRITTFGRLLRSTSLDELPELFNILKGDMSIVGPRPLLIRYLPYYTEEERLRHSVRPGLTGLSQVNGRNVLEWDTRLKLDVNYANEMSFKEDINIMLLTIKKVIWRSDIVVGDQHVLKNLDEERVVVSTYEDK